MRNPRPTALAIAAALSAAWLSACGSSGSACGTCTGETACDPTTKTCVPALSPGSACGAAIGDGGSASTPCQTGSTCATMTSGASVCAVTCDLSGGGAGCPSSEVCGALPAPDGGEQGLCLTAASTGESCDPDSLVDCLPPAACIQPPGASAGTCFDLCDPTQSTSACTGSDSCLGVFTAADAGICATPVAGSGPCSLYANAFCPNGQLCVEAEGSDGGLCFTRCDPSSSACASGLSCLSPLGQGSVSFCALPQANDDACGVQIEEFCSDADLCITATAGSQTGMCEVNCSNGQTCPAGETCNATVMASESYCL